MFTLPYGDATVTVNLYPLLIVFAVAVVLTILFAVILRVRFRKIYNAVVNGAYDRIIKDGEKLLSVFSKSYKSENVRSNIEYLHFALAVAYFDASEEEKFSEHLDAMTLYSDIKEFWLCLQQLQKNDYEAAERHYALIEPSDETRVSRVFLESVKLHGQGETEQARTLMQSIYADIKLHVLRGIAERIME